MIALRGRASSVSLHTQLPRTLWLLTDRQTPDLQRDAQAFLINGDQPIPNGYSLYIAKPGMPLEARKENVIQLPAELEHVQAGDVLSVSSDGQRLAVLWRQASRQNSILLTERCDNYCLMCSQPPKTTDDTWLLERARDLIRILPPDTTDLTFTGGEPTLYGDALHRAAFTLQDSSPGRGHSHSLQRQTLRRRRLRLRVRRDRQSAHDGWHSDLRFRTVTARLRGASARCLRRNHPGHPATRSTRAACRDPRRHP